MMKFRLNFRSRWNKNRLGFGGGTSTSTSNSSPWSGQQPYLSDVMQSAQNQYQNYTPQYFGAQGTTLNGQNISGMSTVAPMNAQENNAISGLGSLGMSGNSSLNAANNSLTNYANGNMLTAANNPGLQSVEQQAAASVTPGLMGGFTQGTTDNPNSIMAASNGVANAVGNIAYNNYNQQSQNQLTADQVAPNLYNTQLGGMNAALSGGQTAQNQSQNELQNLVSMFNYQQQLPYQQLNQYSNLVNGQYGGTTTTSSPVQGLFSDRRLKKNITQIAETACGLPVYEFSYIWDDVVHVGCMADEVATIIPEAIGNILGFATVDYSMVA